MLFLKHQYLYLVVYRESSRTRSVKNETIQITEPIHGSMMKYNPKTRKYGFGPLFFHFMTHFPDHNKNHSELHGGYYRVDNAID